ncbi:hypothetical protein X975_18991, partial [Stegodyphus mimosarum]
MNPASFLKQMPTVFVPGEDGASGPNQPTAVTPGVMVCGTISYDSRSSLVILRTSLIAQYVDTTLRQVTLPFMARYPGARPHTALISLDCLRAVDTLRWLARSPDLHQSNMFGTCSAQVVAYSQLEEL